MEFFEIAQWISSEWVRLFLAVCTLRLLIGERKKFAFSRCLLTSLITSFSGLPADWRIASGTNGSVYDVDAMLPLSDDVALVFDVDDVLL